MNDKKIGRRHFLKTLAASAAGLSVVNTAGTQAALEKNAQIKPAGKASLPRKELGSTGVRVPILQLGTSRQMDPVYDKVMHLCFRKGVDAFDTALNYGWGSSHEAIAKFIEQIGDRKKLWITSKSGSWTLNGLIKDIDKCLQQLRTDYLDLYFMHGINSISKLDPTFIQAGEKLRKSGKTRFFGFSTHGGNVPELLNQAVKTGGIDAILFRYNFRRYGDRSLNVAIDACKNAGIGLIAMKTMGSVPKDAENVVTFRSRNFTLAQGKLKSVWADDRIDSVVSEMVNVREVRENIAAAISRQALSAVEIHQLNHLAALTDHLACHGCSHLCESAIQGQTRIADQLRFLMYHDCHGKTARARELYNRLPWEARSFNNEDIESAQKICPQGIDIAGRLVKAKLELKI